MHFGKIHSQTWKWLAVPVLAAGLAVGIRTASGDDPTGGLDDALRGMLSFVAPDVTACPQGWRPAQETSGRLVVGVTDSDAVGKLIGTPLLTQEDRTHSHAFSVTADLPYKSISAANGGNNQGAGAGKYPDDGQTELAPTGLPFVQLLGCVKQ